MGLSLLQGFLRASTPDCKQAEQLFLLQDSNLVRALGHEFRCVALPVSNRHVQERQFLASSSDGYAKHDENGS